MKMILTFIFRKMINHFRTLPRYSVNARQYLKLCRFANILFLFNSFLWQRQRIDDDCNNVTGEKLFWVLKILAIFKGSSKKTLCIAWVENYKRLGQIIWKILLLWSKLIGCIDGSGYGLCKTSPCMSASRTKTIKNIWLR